MKILGIEIETDFDYNDADDVEKFEKAKKEVIQKLENIDEKNKTDSQILKEGCTYIFNFFDNVLGEGTHEKIFGNKYNIAKCMDAFADFVEEIKKQNNEIFEKVDKIQTKYSPNRATRRAKK